MRLVLLATYRLFPILSFLFFFVKGVSANTSAGPAAGVNITWTSCTSGTVLNTSATGSASYTFGSGDCDGHGFTAICEATGTTASSQARVIVSVASGNNILRFDRTQTSSPFATVTKARFKSTAGDLFQLTNLTVYPVSLSSQTLTVTAYSGGVAVTGSTITINYVTSSPIHGTTLTSTDFGSFYNSIDEIQVTSSLPTGVSIDNIQTGTALPLNLIDFSALRQGNTVSLNWTTAQEQNTSYFEIQRSRGNSQFVPVGRVAAAGNSNFTLQYHYIDTLPAIPAPDYLYRLNMVDQDGKSSYSPQVNISSATDNVLFKVIPNPFREQVTVMAASTEQDIAVFIVTDMSGRRILSQSVPIQAGTNTITLSALSRLDPGTYLLTMYTRQKKQTLSLLKVP